jgi:hypothetical protein
MNPLLELGTGDQSCSVKEEANAFNKALLAKVYHLMQARRCTLHLGCTWDHRPLCVCPSCSNPLHRHQHFPIRLNLRSNRLLSRCLPFSFPFFFFLPLLTPSPSSLSTPLPRHCHFCCSGRHCCRPPVVIRTGNIPVGCCHLMLCRKSKTNVPRGEFWHVMLHCHVKGDENS